MLSLHAGKCLDIGYYPQITTKIFISSQKLLKIVYFPTVLVKLKGNDTFAIKEDTATLETETRPSIYRYGGSCFHLFCDSFKHK